MMFVWEIENDFSKRTNMTAKERVAEKYQLRAENDRSSRKDTLNVFCYFFVKSEMKNEPQFEGFWKVKILIYAKHSLHPF